MAVSTPFTFSGSLTLPPDAGQPQTPLPFSGSANFKSKAEVQLDLVGSGSKIINFGTISAAGAKAILVEVEPDSTATKTPILLSINSSVTGKVEVSPGGFAAVFNPNPVAGIAAVTVEHTSDNCVRIWLLGG
jgi:hypothetical protein